MSTGLRAGTNNDGYLQVNGTDILTALSSGRIGIGTDNPSKSLSILSSQSVMLQLESTSSTARIGFKVPNTSNSPTIGVSDEEDLQFRTGGAERVRITSAGLVGINNSSPAVSLDLSDNTDAVALPTGTTAQRPSGTDAYIRKNSTNNALEFYTGTEWVEIITDYFPTGSTTLG